SMLFGHFGEWPTRMTTLIFLGLFAITVYYFIRKQFDALTALTMAVMLLTSGRILFWDSMLGLIDICFSWIIYLNFMILYHFAKENRWRILFILSYLLFSIAFLLKGLPAVAFQGISVLTALHLHGVFKKKLFSVDHFIGIGIGLLPLVGYYAIYASQVSLDQVFNILLDQSMQRTATHHGWWKTFLHVFTFPVEQLYHFLPWSLLLIAIFHPQFRKWMSVHDFIRFNFWLMVANLPVYWLSVQVYPRYLLMFVPMFNMVGYYIIQSSLKENKGWWKILHYIFLGFAVMALIIILLMPFEQQVRSLPGLVFIWIGGCVILLLCLLSMKWDGTRSFFWFAMILLVVRIIFDLVVLPIRKLDWSENICRDDCQRLAGIYNDRTWYLYGTTFPHEVARFYTSAFSNQIIRHTDSIIDTEAYYLVDPDLYPSFPGRLLDSLILENGTHLTLMQPTPP
ncbi:MAG: ArnT family glycosyltransferase, partial [Chitinophagaceae bacterium]